MSNSSMLIFISLPFFFISFASSSSFNATHKCTPQQALDLLLFKESMRSIGHSYDEEHSIDFFCHDWLGSSGYYPIMMNWNKNTDCCMWDGITCNHLTGDVISIDLSCGMLRGILHPNTTLFNLPRLQKLNLAYNDFSHSQLPREIGRLSNSLTHLNLSYCWFTGEVSVEILFLPKLVSLDLSWNDGLQIPPNVFKNLLQNSTHLRQLLLTDVNIGWVLPTYLNLSSSLRSLNLFHTGLQGKLPDNIFSLPYLEKLGLSYNNEITSPLPKVNTSNDIPLKWLHLSSCSLVGSLPKSLVNLRHLTTLKLSYNKLNGTLPSFLFTLPLLEILNLGLNMFSGSLPLELFNCRSLKRLYLSGNQFDGKINIGSTPLSFIQLPTLTHLDLSENNFTGLWDLNTLLSSLPNLQTLRLSYSGLIVVSNNGTSYVNHHPELRYLRLASCNLTVFPESLRAMKNLTDLDLSSNNIQGQIPQWAQLQWDGLEYLNLMSNQLQGPFPPSICNMRNLLMLDISNNMFRGVIPQCLGNITSSLQYLNVMSNQLQGPFPPTICNMRNLYFLDISNNRFSGVIPQCFGSITSSLQYLNVKSNHLQGPFPPSICNMSRLISLDMSNNRFSGMIPRCFANISSSLVVVDLGNNHFHGTIPNMYEECGYLQGLILNGNQLQGEVPSSLSKCKSLKVLDLGNNRLNGTFPHWLGDLPMLQVLVLKSNNLHGAIETSSTKRSAFPSIRILDLSHNGFVGNLPRKYFQSFNAMKNVGKNNTQPEYLDVGYKYYSMVIAVKGVEQLFLKLFTGYTIVDLSNNRFEGEIPGIIGGLTSLKVLNLSHNILTGQIPNDLGNLLEIESLDLSCNQLTGEIAQSLADITGLEVLNLSQNNLEGRIPYGTQFNTFNASFEGNPKLCGFPLPKKCEHPQETQAEVDGDGDGDGDGESKFTWKVVMMGYGCGTILGIVMGYLMLSTGRPKWFNEIADAAEHMICTKQNKRI